MSTMTMEEAISFLAKTHAESQAEFKAHMRKMDIRIAQIDRLTGSLQRNFGELTELILMPRISETINKFGHEFYVTSPNKRFKSKDGKTLTEVDLLLENGDEAMAIEIKSNFKVEEIGEHVKRLEILRKNESITGMKNRVMYAGIAGVTIDDPVRDLALANGMYVMTMHEEEDRVDVIPPKEKKRW